MYTLLVTGDVPGASTYFNPLLQQSVIPTTSGARPSSPPDGMLIWETDTERYMTYNATNVAWMYMGQILTGVYTPAITAASGGLVLGTGNAVGGRYTLRNGNWCDCQGLIKWGSTGLAAGTGSYSITLPFNRANTLTAGDVPLGTCRVLDSSVPAAYLGVPFGSAAASTMQILMGGTPSVGPSQMAPTIPMAWATNDVIAWNITYEIA